MAAAPGRRLATGLVGAGLLAGTWYALRSEAVQRADVRAGDALRWASSAAADRAVVATTDLGSMYAVAGTSAVLAAAGRGRTAVDLAGLGALAWTIAQRSKTRVSRARPYDAYAVRRLIRKPTGSSFPSGHAAVAAATSALLADRIRASPARWALRALGAYVALSRVYVGVHYPTDVIGGAGLGLALSSLWGGPVARLTRAAFALAWRLKERRRRCGRRWSGGMAREAGRSGGAMPPGRRARALSPRPRSPGGPAPAAAAR